MTIDWNNFTPWASLSGGLLIGLASALFLLFNGRIAGVPIRNEAKKFNSRKPDALADDYEN